jgi:CcmD family protein
MSDLIYLYAAYTVIWAGVFLYVLKLHLAQRKLKQETEMLKEIIDEKRNKKNL